MSVLKFSLSPDATARIHDLLLCLAKFSEHVSLEARGDQLTLTALNSSRTGYASFGLEPRTFFLSYDFDTSQGNRFTCQLYNKALLSVFRGRIFDPRGGDTSIDRCEVSVEDQPDKVECRIIVKMICRHGVVKTYRLTYESVEVSHALFDKNAAPNGWKISSRLLREYIEYFGARTEQLDFLAKDHKAIFTSFTEKIMDGKELLKQPLETAIALHMEDFEDFHVEEDMHIVITVKDFKAIVTHVETLKGSLSAQFSRPGRPLQFSYTATGMKCEFTLMTTGDSSRSSTQSTAPRIASTRPSSRQPSIVPDQSRQPSFAADHSRQTSVMPVQSRQPSAVPVQSVERRTTDMGPPSKPASVGGLRERKGLSSVGRDISQATTTSDKDSESLFMPLDDDDRHWDPPNLDEEGPEEMLGWDANADIGGYHPTFRDTGGHAPTIASESFNTGAEGLPPTQRLSQMHGLFD